MDSVLQKLKEIVGKELSSSLHDFDHVMRVYELCLKLTKSQKSVNLKVLETAALLHDIARVEEDEGESGKIDHAFLGAEKAEKILQKMDYSDDEIEKIKHCIITHRFRNEQTPQTIEAKILFDADKIDSLGAIGIARMFAWAGENKAKLYKEVDLEEYVKENFGGNKKGMIRDKSNHSPQIEFEMKLKFLKGQMYTPAAKKLAQNRTRYTKSFLKRLKKEVQGDL